MRRILILAILTLTWLLPRSGTAQVEFPITPGPADCVADPIDIDRLVEQSATPTTLEPAEPPEDRSPATPEIREQIVSVIVSSVACTNANQPLRALSFFTENYLLHRIGDEPSVILGHLKAAATRDPDVAPVEDRVTIIEVVTVNVWSDGKAAQVVLRWSSGDVESLVGLRLREEAGALKIDEVITDDATLGPLLDQEL